MRLRRGGAPCRRPLSPARRARRPQTAPPFSGTARACAAPGGAKTTAAHNGARRAGAAEAVARGRPSPGHPPRLPPTCCHILPFTCCSSPRCSRRSPPSDRADAQLSAAPARRRPAFTLPSWGTEGATLTTSATTAAQHRRATQGRATVALGIDGAGLLQRDEGKSCCSLELEQGLRLTARCISTFSQISLETRVTLD